MTVDFLSVPVKLALANCSQPTALFSKDSRSLRGNRTWTRQTEEADSSVR
jgi:hypothetical protein